MPCVPKRRVGNTVQQPHQCTTPNAARAPLLVVIHTKTCHEAWLRVARTMVTRRLGNTVCRCRAKPMHATQRPHVVQSPQSNAYLRSCSHHTAAKRKPKLEVRSLSSVSMPACVALCKSGTAFVKTVRQGAMVAFAEVRVTTSRSLCHDRTLKKGSPRAAMFK